MPFIHKPLYSSSSSSLTSPSYLSQEPTMQTSHKVTILEVNLISAQELKPSRKSSNMQTYVVAYIDPKQKLMSRIDEAGNENPTWNDKFIFAIADDLEFARPNLCIVFEIYKVGRRRFRKDKRIGVVHVLLENLIHKNQGCSKRLGGKFMAFNVRSPSPSTMPQGILNIGVVTLHGVFHEALQHFFTPSVAIDYRKLTGSD